MPAKKSSSQHSGLDRIADLNLSQSSFFQLRTSLEVKTGLPGKGGPWSEMDRGPNMSSLIAQSECMKITSWIPPCVCVGWFTWCTNPKESRSRWSYKAAGSVGFLKWTFRLSGMISCELKVANSFQQISKFTEKYWIWGTEPGLYTTTMTMGPRGVENGRVILETSGGKLDEVQIMAAKNGVIPTPAGPLKHNLWRYLFTTI